MRLTVLGSGDAFSGCGCNAGYLIDDRVLIDCGAPAHVLLPRRTLSVDSIETILITHFHADHTFMLPLVLGARAFVAPSDRPLRIAGPVGTREYVERLLTDGFGPELCEMLMERVPVEYIGLQDGVRTQIGDHSVAAHAVVHSTGPSLAYVISDASGASAGISGDTTLCAGLRRTIAAAQVMVCECSGWDGPVDGGHLWRGEVEELIAAHPQTRFVVSHLPRRGELRGALVAHDLLTIDF